MTTQPETARVEQVDEIALEIAKRIAAEHVIHNRLRMPTSQALALMQLSAASAYATAYAAGLSRAAEITVNAVTYVVGEQRDLCDRIAAEIRTEIGEKP